MFSIQLEALTSHPNAQNVFLRLNIQLQYLTIDETDRGKVTLSNIKLNIMIITVLILVLILIMIY